jgi:predicted AlkP superfamily phosphohydrolase/phosphomutase
VQVLDKRLQLVHGHQELRYREKREIKDMQEYLALLGQWDKKETWVYLANKDNKASQGKQAHREHTENHWPRSARYSCISLISLFSLLPFFS